jgi:hypothetical protein
MGVWGQDRGTRLAVADTRDCGELGAVQLDGDEQLAPSLNALYFFEARLGQSSDSAACSCELIARTASPHRTYGL